MKTQAAGKVTVLSDRARSDDPERGWFLRDSVWDDVVWIFAPTNLLEEERPHRIRWDFTLPSGLRFTDPKHAALLQSARQFLSLLRTRSLQSGLAQRSSTVAKYFLHLRGLIQWMDTEGCRRFSDLDSVVERSAWSKEASWCLVELVQLRCCLHTRVPPRASTHR